MVNVRGITKIEYQYELTRRMDKMIAEKIHQRKNGILPYNNVLELDILENILIHLKSVFNLTDEEVDPHIVKAWAMVKIHNEMLVLYKQQEIIHNENYLKLLNTVVNNVFINLFTDDEDLVG